METGFWIAAGMIGSTFLLLYFLRDKISVFSVTRNGIEVRTNDVPVWSEVVDNIDRIDINTSRSIRKGTTGLLILDPNKYDMSAEVMQINYEANQPLIYAAYENHHTRELDAENGIENYITDKSYDVKAVLRIWKLKFPELTDDMIDGHVRRWIKKIIVPNLRRACSEKLDYYRAQVERDDVSRPLKGILRGCITKNEHYLSCIEELSAHSDIRLISSIIQPTS